MPPPRRVSEVYPNSDEEPEAHSIGGGGATATTPAWLLSPVLYLALGKLAVTVAFDVIYTFGSEVFPTSVRATAMAYQSCASRVAGLFTPPLLLLDSTISPTFSLLVFAGFCGCAGLICRAGLPETLGRDLSAQDEVVDGGLSVNRGGRTTMGGRGVRTKPRGAGVGPRKGRLDGIEQTTGAAGRKYLKRGAGRGRTGMHQESVRAR